MTDAVLRARYIAKGAWISMDLLGTRFELEADGRPVTISLPSNPDDFADHDPTTPYERWPSLAAAGPVFAEQGVDARTAALVIFEVVVHELHTDFPFPKPASPTDDQRQMADATLLPAQELADSVAAQFLRHVRALAPNQPWLGMSAERPQQYGITQLEYADTGERILGYGPVMSTTMGSSRIRIEKVDLQAAVDQMRKGAEPEITRLLLAEASYLGDSAGANDLDRAILVAATACEVKVKRTIRHRLAPGQLALAEMILTRRSNLPELVDEVMRAALGVSLRLDDPELFKRVTALAKQRNAVIHGGKRDPKAPFLPAPETTASQLFTWLDRLPMASTTAE